MCVSLVLLFSVSGGVTVSKRGSAKSCSAPFLCPDSSLCYCLSLLIIVSLNEDVVVPRYNKKAGSCSLSFSLAVLWNSFPTEAKRSKSLLEFRSAVCAMLDCPSAASRLKSLVFDSVSTI